MDRQNNTPIIPFFRDEYEKALAFVKTYEYLEQNKKDQIDRIMKSHTSNREKAEKVMILTRGNEQDRLILSARLYEIKQLFSPMRWLSDRGLINE